MFNENYTTVYKPFPSTFDDLTWAAIYVSSTITFYLESAVGHVVIPLYTLLLQKEKGNGRL